MTTVTSDNPPNGEARHEPAINRLVALPSPSRPTQKHAFGALRDLLRKFFLLSGVLTALQGS